MSRCFPYPPPGYTLSRASKEALIESIKLQKEREKAKEQRKEKKREKKERRKEKKEKKEDKKEKNVETNQKLEKYDTPKVHIGKSIWANSELLEQSSLTEEHEQPVCLPLPSSSSDSTENSNKRKRQSSPIVGNHGYSNIIRIRLPSKKQNVPDVSINEQQLCSTSGRTDIPAQNKDEIGLRNRQENFCCPSEEINNFGHGFTLRTDKKLICLTSGKNDAVAPGKTGTPSVPDAATASIQREKLLYRNLIENWVPPLQHDTCFDPDDLDWLFHGKNQGVRTEKRQKSENDCMSCSGSSSLWQPRAQYLPEVDVYALPFTVPF